MPEFFYKSLTGETMKIEEVASLPRELFLNLIFRRDLMLSGHPEKCVYFSWYKRQDSDDQPVNMPGNFDWQSDDELVSYHMSLICILRDIEKEIASRKEYRKIVGEEIAGMTGADSAGTDTAGPTGKDL